MNILRYTLLSDGSSDRALLPILNWILSQHLSHYAIQAEWADLRRLRTPPRRLPDRIITCLDLYPCDLLFIHRDSERSNPENRYSEITRAKNIIHSDTEIPSIVGIVPIHMMEAWLLFNENAIRKAAGNPHGEKVLALPNISELENISNPKQILKDILIEASELKGRRLKTFRKTIAKAIHRIPDYIDDFSPLNNLSAFQKLESDINTVIDTI